MKRAAEKKAKEDEVTRKKKKALKLGKEEDRGAFGQCARGRAAGDRRSEEGQKKGAQEKLAAVVKALDPGRSGRGRNREQSAAAVAAEHGNFR
jgi:hypothetical protein